MSKTPSIQRQLRVSFDKQDAAEALKSAIPSMESGFIINTAQGDLSLHEEDAVMVQRLVKMLARKRAGIEPGHGMQVSLDGGSSYLEAPEGVRVIYSNLIAGENETPVEAHINLTREGIISDIWGKGDDQEGPLGSDTVMIDDIVARVFDWDEQYADAPYSEALEEMLKHAVSRMASLVREGKSVPGLHRTYATWMADTISNFPDELDNIADEPVRGLPGPITWRASTDSGGTEDVVFMPSDAINQLRMYARSGGLSNEWANVCEEFSIRYGNKLDSILKNIVTEELSEEPSYPAIALPKP